MAGWISSKLKVAETFLQHIDQQAAESLGKNEKPRSNELNYETPTKTGGVVPLKDQLKKKTLDSNESYGNLRNDSDSDRHRVKELPAPQKLSSQPTTALTDSDWTELLSTPKQPTPPAVTRSNGTSEVRGPRKDGRKQSNPGSTSFPPEAKKFQNNRTSVSKLSKRLDTEPENRVNGGAASYDSKKSDGEESGSSDLVQKRSSFEAQNGDGHVGERENVWISTGANLLLEPKGDGNQKNKSIPGNAENGKQSGSEFYHESDSARNVMKSQDGNCIPKVEALSSTLDVKTDVKSEEDGDHNGSRSVAGRVDKTNAVSGSSITHDLLRASSTSDEGSDSDSDSSSTSESENERKRRAERAKRRKQIMAEKAAARAVQAIKEHENMVAKLEGEKQSLEKILEERARQQAQEASELQTSMMETMEAVELEKQKHNNTRMEALSRLAKFETSNADLAKSLATTQWNLEVEVNRVAMLRQQIELKEAINEELGRKMSEVHQGGSSSDQLEAAKGVEFEQEILEAEYSFVCDKIGQLQEKAKKLEEDIETTRKEIENPTEIEVQLKKRLAQLTDHLIQKQAQVEALSSEKATLLFRIETISRLLDENKSTLQLTDLAGPSANNDLEAGTWELSNSKLKPLLKDRIRSGGEKFGSLLWQLDAVFSAGAAFLRRNSIAKVWSLVYLLCLHFWVVYILMSHSQPSEDATSGAVISLGSINKTAGI
ncbi:PREDICTED: golgin candidate 2 [Nelumbo nucifera]|uniref:Golgin candidate 2 n=2 Tax=Nelumbo nucifera TaxID=4432 RepID=A0A822YD67_NELNU|nr:PREDICTED: golgin candidate 2 [Nelumbo nucifera]DAD32074.1 TPA_asm: hypothetical protein HUJ06_010925 [Nelumbo nucifera]